MRSGKLGIKVMDLQKGQVVRDIVAEDNQDDQMHVLDCCLVENRQEVLWLTDYYSKSMQTHKRFLSKLRPSTVIFPQAKKLGW